MKKFQKWRNILLAAEAVGAICAAILLFLSEYLAAFILIAFMAVFALTFFGLWQALKKKGIQMEMDISRVLGKDAKNALTFGDVGIITYNDEYVCTWCSDYFKIHGIELLNKKLTSWIENIRSLFEDEADSIVGKSKDQVYLIEKKQGNQVLYVKNITEVTQLKTKLESGETVVGILTLDNYGEYQSYENEEVLNDINSGLRGALIAWTKEHGMFLRRLRGDRFLVILNRKILEEIRQDNFRILQTIKDKAYKMDVSITLSMVFAYGAPNFVELDSMLNELLEIVDSRGGDQAVIKKYGAPAEFIGGSTEKSSGRSKVRVRIMAESLEDLMKDSGKVFILGHQHTDYDCMGSALAASAWAKSLHREPYIVLKDVPRDHQLQETMYHYRKAINDRHNFVTEEEALRLFNPAKDLLIMVDHGNPAMSSGKQLLEMEGRKVAVIDHHRRSEDFVESPAIAYVESQASSVSELLSELLSASTLSIPIFEAEATLMYLGILVDTNRFKTHTSERTFQAAAVLSSWGANAAEAEKELQEDYDSFSQKNEIISHASMYLGRFLIAVSDRPVSRTLLAQTSEELLKIKGCQAAFTIGVNEVNKAVAVSARSGGTFNVQKIMEKLGGGGHFAAAALERENTTVYAVEEELKKALKEEEEKKS